MDYVQIAAHMIELLATPQATAIDIGKLFNDYKITYAITGGVALSTYNYNRTTDDVDIVVSKESFDTIQNDLVGRYFTMRPGSTRNMYYTRLGRRVPVDIIIEGDNKCGIELGNPIEYREKRNGVWWVKLHKLLEIKITGGFQKNREADWPDVIRLIRENSLPRNLMVDQDVEKRVKVKYLSLWDSAQEQDEE